MCSICVWFNSNNQCSTPFVTRFPLRPIVMVTSLVLGYFIFNPIYFTETLETYDPKYNRFFSSTKLVHFKKDNVEKFLARLEDSTLQNSGFVISNVYKDVLKINHNIPSAKLGIFFQNSAGRYKEMWKNLIRFDEGFIIFDSEIKDKKWVCRLRVLYLLD
ncbi:MAG: hypothetical protein IPL35_15215 [Sphingobacteriales bacterium]|nr:hypothetical protein [Sphingobacteriales bacterium]